MGGTKTEGFLHRSAAVTGARMVGYIRVSTLDQANSGAGLEAQRQTIRAACARAGHQLVTILADHASGKAIDGRPKLRRALHLVATGKADGIVAARLDRLSRSVPDFANLLEQAGREGWSIVVCDLGMDTGTPEGQLMWPPLHRVFGVGLTQGWRRRYESHSH